MSGLGDDFRKHRERKKRDRLSWWECPMCAIAYGGNGTKNPPDRAKCFNCNYVEPTIAAKEPAP